MTPSQKKAFHTLQTIRSGPHFTLSLIATLFMGVIIVEKNETTRGIMVVGLMSLYFATIIVLGLEHEAMKKRDVKNYVLRLCSEFEEAQKKATPATPSSIQVEGRKISRQELDYLLSRT